MEALGVAANAISIVDLALRTTSATITYAKEVFQASEQRRLLANEASSLYSTLVQLRVDTISNSSCEKWLAQNQSLLSQIENSVAEMATLLKFDGSNNALKKERKLQAIATAARWPSTKTNIYAILQQISRLQSYVSTILLLENGSVHPSLVQNHCQLILWLSKILERMNTKQTHGEAFGSL